LMFLEKKILSDNLISYFILLMSTFVFCFSFISHYALYTYQRDMGLLKATGLSFLANIFGSFLLIPRYGINGAAMAQLVAFSVMYIAKIFYWRKYIRSL